MPTGFFFGALLPLFAIRRIRASQPSPLGGVVPLATLAVAWFALTVQLALAWYPDWMWSYLIDATTISPAFAVVFFAAVTGAGAAGAIISQAFIARGQTPGAVATAIFGFSMYAAVFNLTWDRYFHVGNYFQYHNALAKPLNGHAGLQNLMSWLGAAEAIVLLGVVAWLLISDRSWKTHA
ncbi:MAG: hypothetical protein FJZ00_01765 [Candidatus Sericytochromatia bacterium]|uniref:Uncharacterized protein n=1 Tax=Candidatus Tanganyikabacteria bacterium TaxID=2961651 RepID=A0A937X0P9_9BACT|nr:hypothetical protein [Candidatus Tanganyikabacteria bacterium]